MKKTIMLLIALLFTLSCAGVQEGKAPGTPVLQPMNYTGTWTGSVNVQGQTGTLTMSLIHEGDKITGTMSDASGMISNAQLTNAVLKDKTLSFSIILESPQGSVPINFTGAFSEDNKEYAATLEVPIMQMTADVNFVKS